MHRELLDQSRNPSSSGTEMCTYQFWRTHQTVTCVGQITASRVKSLAQVYNETVDNLSPTLAPSIDYKLLNVGQKERSDKAWHILSVCGCVL